MTGQQLIDAADLIDGHAFIRFRDRKWNEGAYARIYVVLVNGKRTLGPWLNLFDRRVQKAIAEPTPQTTLTLLSDLAAFYTEDAVEPYTGPLDPKDVA